MLNNNEMPLAVDPNTDYSKMLSPKPPSNMLANATDTGLSIKPPQEKLSVYDQAVNDFNNQKQDALSASFMAVAGKNPDKAAEHQRIADQTGVGQDIVSRNEQELKKRDDIMRLQAYDLINNNSVLADLMTDPNFASVAHDDVENLTSLGGLLQTNSWLAREALIRTPLIPFVPFTDARTLFGVQNPVPEVFNEFTEQFEGQQTQRAVADYYGYMLANKFTKAQLSPEQKEDLEQLESKMAPPIETAVFGGTGYTTGQMYAMRDYLLAGATVGGGTGGVLGAIGGPFAPATVPTGIVVGMGLGTKFGASAYTAYIESAFIYKELIEADVPVEDAAFYAKAGGSINAAIEFATFGTVTRPASSIVRNLIIAKLKEKIAKKTIGAVTAQAVKGVTTSIGAEVAQEVLQELAPVSALEAAGVGISQPELIERFTETAEQAFLASVALGSVGPSVTLVSDVKKIADQTKSEEFLNNLSKGVSNTKLHKRAPNALYAFLELQTKGTAAETMYVDAEELATVLNQSGLTPQQIDNALPNVREQLSNATKGSDVQIPTAQFAANIVGTKLETPILAISRIDPNGFTPKQAMAKREQMDQLKADAEIEMAAQNKTNSQFVKEAKEIEADLVEQLIAVGRTPTQAAFEAKLVQALVVTSAAKANMTPAQWVAAHPLPQMASKKTQQAAQQAQAKPFAPQNEETTVTPEQTASLSEPLALAESELSGAVESNSISERGKKQINDSLTNLKAAFASGKLADMASRAWDFLKRLEQNPGMKAASELVAKTLETLKKLGVEIYDPIGATFTEGWSEVEVINYLPYEEGVSKDRSFVAQVMRPVVRKNGQLIQRGQVIIQTGRIDQEEFLASRAKDAEIQLELDALASKLKEEGKTDEVVGQLVAERKAELEEKAFQERKIKEEQRVSTQVSFEQAAKVATPMPSVTTAKPISPIGLAIASIPASGPDSIADSKSFFQKVWKRMLVATGKQIKTQSDDSVKAAAKLAVADIQEFVKNYSQFSNYYSQDWIKTRSLLDGYAGRAITDDEFLMYRIICGLTSPNTQLASNISDTVKLWTHWMNKGSFDDFLLGKKPITDNLVVFESAESISGTTANTKIRTVKIIFELSKKLGSVKAAIDYLREPVSAKELHEVKKTLGYSGGVANIGNVRALVKMATGQDTLIPRMFIFGQKVGAYALNSIGDERYTTVDIWESRYIRSFFSGMFGNEIGLPVDEKEHDLFVRFGYAFKDEMERVTGRTWTPSSLQALRWFYIISATRAAGYSKASTSETISAYTNRVLQSTFDYNQPRETNATNSTTTPPRKSDPQKYERDINADLDAAGITDPKQRRQITTESWVRFARRHSKSDSVGFQFDTDRTGVHRRSGVLKGLATVATHTPGLRLVSAFAKAGISVQTYVELAPKEVKAFSDRVRAISKNSKFGAALHVYSDEEYMGKRLFISESGKSGFALSPDGDIVSVFSDDNSREGRGAVALATQMGGTKLDCFDTILPALYGAHGFRAVARTRWNDKYTPDRWDFVTFAQFNGGRPDVVYMVYEANHFDTYSNTDGVMVEIPSEANAIQAQDIKAEQDRALTSEAQYAKLVQSSSASFAQSAVLAPTTQQSIALAATTVAQIPLDGVRPIHDVRQTLLDKFGNVVDRLLDSGRLVIASNASDLVTKFKSATGRNLDKQIENSIKADRIKAEGTVRAWMIFAEQKQLVDFNSIKSVEDAKASAEKQYQKIMASIPEFDADAYLNSLENREIEALPPVVQNAVQQWRKGNKTDAMKDLFERVTQQRQESIAIWKNYLEVVNEDYAADPNFRHYVVEYLFGSFSKDNPNTGLPFNAAALSLVHNKIAAGEAPRFDKLYSKALLEVTKDLVKLGDETNGWRKIPQTSKLDPNFKARVAEVQSISSKGWCTRTTHAEIYLPRGDFWVYIHNGQPAIAIRFEGKDIGEIQGPANNGSIPYQYVGEVEKLVESGELGEMKPSTKKALEQASEKARALNSIISQGATEQETAKGVEAGKDVRIFKTKDGKIILFGDGKVFLSSGNKVKESYYADVTLYEDVSVPALTTVVGDVTLEGGASAPALTTITGEVTLYKGASVPALTTVIGNVELSAAASAPALTTVTGNVELYPGASAPALTTVIGDVRLWEDASASALTTVTGNVELYRNTSALALTTVVGDVMLFKGASAPALTTVTGNVKLWEDASAPALTTVTGNVALYKGASASALTTVTGNVALYKGASAPALTTVTGNVELYPGASAPLLNRTQEGTQRSTSQSGGTVQGLTDNKTKTMFLVASSLTSETAPAVLAHEVTHGFATEKMQQSALDLLNNRSTGGYSIELEMLLEKVYERTVSAGVVGNASEALGYIVEEAMIAGRVSGSSVIDDTFIAKIVDMFGETVGNIVRDFVAFVRARMSASGIQLELSVDDMVQIAIYGMHQMANGETANFDINAPVVSASKNQTLFQSSKDGARGTYDPIKNLLTLGENADYSTVAHEMAHWYLAATFAEASETNATEATKSDADILLKWFGIAGETFDQRLANWNSMTLEQQRKSHETFAYNWETYLFEGKAPSVELQGVFDRFRKWLVRTYISIRNDLNAIYKQEFGTDLPFLTPEVRGVFDRMLASEKQITRREAIDNFKGVYQTQEESGMDDGTWAAYQAEIAEAHEMAVTDLTKASVKQMEWLSGARRGMLKKLQAAHNALRKSIRGEEFDKIKNEPIRKAERFLKTGKMLDAEGNEVVATTNNKLDKALVDAMYPSTIVRSAASVDLSKLRDMITVNGLAPDVVAEMFGFSSGDELIRNLSKLKPIKDELAERTDKRMLDEHGGMNTEQENEEEINKALANETRARFVAIENRFLTKAKTPVSVILQGAKELAKTILGRIAIKDIKPRNYVASEAKVARDKHTAVKAMQSPETAGKSAYTRSYNEQIAAGVDPATAVSVAQEKSAEAAKRAQAKIDAYKKQYGDVDPAVVAIKASHQQVIQNQLAKEAYKILDEVDKALAYVKKIVSDANRKNMGAEHADQIEAILERFGLMGKYVAPTTRMPLATWAQVQQEIGFDIEIPDIVQESVRKNFLELTPEEFQDVIDTVKQIAHIGKTQQFVLTMDRKTTFEKAKTEIVDSINANADGRKANTRTALTNVGRTIEALTGFFATHLKAAIAAQIMDGGKDGGPLWNYLIRSGNTAGNKKTTMRAAATKRISEILDPVFRGGKRGGAGVYFPSVDRSFNRESVLTIALNMGNESNMQRLLGGEGWTLEQVMPIIQSLTAAELNAVQEVWDYLETFKAEIIEKSRRTVGREPNWIEPKPLQVMSADGQMISLKGGYYPVKYDPRASARSQSLSAADQALRDLKDAHIASTTRRSYTKPRVREVYDRPLLLNLSGLYSGIGEVIHDLSYHEWLIDANRLMRSSAFDKAVREQYGVEFINQITAWIKDVAAGEKLANNNVEMAFDYLRQGVAAAGLGFYLIVAAGQITGLSQAVVKVGPKWIGRGIAATASNPKAAIERVYALSTFMENRGSTQFRELNEIKNMVRGENVAMKRVMAGTYFLLVQVQRMVDIPTWIGAYEKQLSINSDEKLAKAIADQAVIDSQGGGMLKDLSAIERGGPIQKLFTVFYGFMNTNLNLAVLKGMTEKNAGKWVAQQIMLWVVPVVSMYMLKKLLTPQVGDDDDDDGFDLKEMAKELAAEELSFLMGSFVVVREFADAAKIVTGAKTYGTDYRGPTGLRVIEDVYEFTTQARQGEFDKGFRKAAIDIIGSSSGLPAVQINKTIDGIEALLEGETENITAPLFGVKKR